MSKKNGHKLTFKQQRFVDLFKGNGFQAVKEAGYEGNDATLRVTASRLLTNHNIQAAIEARTQKDKVIQKRILNRKELQEFWSDMVNDPEADPKDRLKAGELLGRSQAMFTDKVLIGDLEEQIKRLDETKLDEQIRRLYPKATTLDSSKGEATA